MNVSDKIVISMASTVVAGVIIGVTYLDDKILVWFNDDAQTTRIKAFRFLEDSGLEEATL